MVERLGWTLAHFVWQGAALALLLATALAFARTASARLRYGLASGALLLMALCPLTTFALLAPSGSEAVVPSSGALRFSEGFRGSEARASLDLLTTLVRLWALGVVLLSLRLVGGLVHLRRWRMLWTSPAGAEWQSRLDVLRVRLRIRKTVGLLFSERIDAPAAWGVLKPFIVLPASLLAGLSPESVEAVLLHELAHIRRHDYLLNLLQACLETILFYHPAVWWVSSVVRREREHCCDDVVVATIDDPMPYARALLQLEERRQRAPQFALSAKGSNLMNRIARILGAKPAPARLSPLASGVVAIAVLGTVLGGAIEAQAQSQSNVVVSKEAVATDTRRQEPSAVPAIKVEPQKKATLRSSIAVSAHETAIKAQLVAEKARSARLQAELAKLKADRTHAGEALPVPITIRRASSTPAKATRTTSVTKAAERLVLREAATSSVSSASTISPQELEDSFTEAGGLFGIDVKDAPFVSVVRRLAQRAGLQIVVTPGGYLDITMRVDPRSKEEFMALLCRAGGATFRKEGDIYYIAPVAPSGAAGLGGGFGR